MRIRVLGPLEVEIDGAVRAIPGAGEREVLALLALQPGRVVSVDRLVDALWGEDLPANPANALQVRVSKLRRALTAIRADGGGAVATRAPGYALQIGNDAVVALAFGADVEQARAASDRDESDEATRATARRWSAGGASRWLNSATGCGRPARSAA